MKADAGMVRIQAQTMRPATPQRTADSRRIAPTPTIAPVIVCVVLIPTPSMRRNEEAVAAPRLRGKTADRLQLGDLRAHRVDDAPAAGQRAEANRDVRGEHDPERDGELAQVAGGEEHAGNDAHGLLRVVGAVHQAEERGRQQLQPPEQWSTRAGGVRRNSQRTAVINARPTTSPISGATTMKMSVLVQPAGMMAPKPGLGHRRAGVAAEQRVRRAGRAARSTT